MEIKADRETTNALFRVLADAAGEFAAHQRVTLIDVLLASLNFTKFVVLDAEEKGRINAEDAKAVRLLALETLSRWLDLRPSPSLPDEVPAEAAVVTTTAFDVPCIPPPPETLRDLNRMLFTHWMGPGREYDDALFVSQLLERLQRRYGPGILTLGQLEARTGRLHERHRTDPNYRPIDVGLVNGHSRRYHRCVCKCLQVSVGPMLAFLEWAKVVFEFSPDRIQLWLMAQAGRLL